MSIIAQSCAMGSLLVIFYVIITNKRLHMAEDKLFLAFLGNNAIELILDIVTVRFIRDNPNSMASNIICRFYLLTLIMAGILLYLYTESAIYAQTNVYGYEYVKKNSTRSKIYAGVVLSSAVLMLILAPGNAFSNYNGRTIYGPAPMFTYLYMFVLMASTWSLLIRFRAVITKKFRNIIIFCIIIWLSAALVQLNNPTFLIVSYAVTLGVLIMFLELENPKMLIDITTGLFNKEALLIYERFLKKKGTKYNMIVVHIPDDQFSADERKVIKKDIVDRLNSNSAGYGFKNKDNEYVFLFNDDDKNRPTATEAMTEGIESFVDKHDAASKLAFSIVTDAEEKDFTKIDESLINCSPGIVKTISNEEYQKMCEVEVIKQMILDAIEENRVVIHLQPIYSNKLKKFTAAEVLTRIIDRDGNIIQPGMFIGVAEDTGLIYKLEEVIMDKTFDFLNRVDIKDLGLEYVEVNLSIKSGENKSFVNRYNALVDKYNVPAHYVNLEITETAILSQKQHLLENMNALISKGVSFSLDDFGSGESNLNYVIDMPIEFLKFDMNITRAFFVNDKASIVMKSAINMAHELGLKTVAEGVETEDMLKQMQEIGIDYIQGYYFSQALPIEQFITFIKKHNNIKEE